MHGWTPYWAFQLLGASHDKFRIRPKAAIITEAEIEAALAARKEARAAKDFAKSDAIRDDLIAKGVEVMDGDPLGWDWNWIFEWHRRKAPPSRLRRATSPMQVIGEEEHHLSACLLPIDLRWGGGSPKD